MNGWDLALAIVIIAVVAFAVYKSIKRRGRCAGCDGSCESCSVCSAGKRECGRNDSRERERTGGQSRACCREKERE